MIVGMVVKYLPVFSYICALSFCICMVSLVVFMFVFYAFCYDNLGVWICYGRGYRSCVPSLCWGEVYVYDVFIVFMLVVCVIFC